MIPKIFYFIKKPTSLNIIINSLGNVVNVGFITFFALVLVRILPPIQYGSLSVLLGIAYVLANVLDFGTSATIYSYLPQKIEKRENIHQFLKTIFAFQTIFSSIIVLLLFIFFPYLDKILFKTGVSQWELYLTAFSVLFLIWQNYAMNALFAAKRFFQANLYLNLSNALKTLALLIIIFVNQISVGRVIFIFGILGPLLFFIFLFFEKKHHFIKLAKAPIERKEFRFSYTLTYFLGMQFFNLASRIDLFLLSFFYPQTSLLGHYGLAQKIILTLMASVTSITQVLSPSMANVSEKKEAKKQLINGLYYLLIPSFLYLLLALTPSFIFEIVFTKKYLPTAAITHLLSLSYAFLPIINLFQIFLLYTRKKPVYILKANFIFFLIALLGNWFFIPKFNVFAPAIVYGIGFLISAIYLFWATIKEYRQIKN